MTEEKITYDVWMVVTNSHSWGRGHYLNEALSNALKEGVSSIGKPTQMHVYEFRNVENVIDVYCDGLGTVHYPISAEMRKASNIDIPASMIKAFTAFDDAVDELRYGNKAFEVFDD